MERTDRRRAKNKRMREELFENSQSASPLELPVLWYAKLRHHEADRVRQVDRQTKTTGRVARLAEASFGSFSIGLFAVDS